MPDRSHGSGLWTTDREPFISFLHRAGAPTHYKAPVAGQRFRLVQNLSCARDHGRAVFLHDRFGAIGIADITMGSRRYDDLVNAHGRPLLL